MWVVRIVFFLFVLLLGGCGTLDYYSHTILGHLSLMADRESIDRLLENDGIDPGLRDQLQLATEIKAYAVSSLSLPNSDSYTQFVSLRKPYVVWNVIATPEFSTQPLQWCYPIVGCVVYRGYFTPERANTEARKLKKKGYDVMVGGVRAYSTLGWFDDPVLSSMLENSDTYLASLIFHELAHQVIFVPDDVGFNESFAVAVEREGVRRWLTENGQTELALNYHQTQNQQDTLVKLMLNAREELDKAYVLDIRDQERRQRKAIIIDQLRQKYRERQASFGLQHGAWFSSELNNAHFAMIATYYEHVDEFSLLLRSSSDWHGIFEQVSELSELPSRERKEAIATLAQDTMVKSISSP